MRLDKYTCCARLFPALIVSSPLLLVLFLVLPSVWKLLGGISAVGLSAALVFLLGQLGRDLGKRKENSLFNQMGGKPTTRLLRHADTHLPPATKLRYHRYLEANVPSFHVPTVQQESADPATADRAYDSAADWLRARTRDKTINDLLLAENTYYGFRRNLWAMKGIGIGICITGIAAIDVLYMGGFHMTTLTAPVALTLSAVMVIELAFWLLVAQPEWVSVPAIAYAKTLLEYCDR